MSRLVAKACIRVPSELQLDNEVRVQCNLMRESLHMKRLQGRNSNADT